MNNHELEYVACPLGCNAGQKTLVTAYDRLHQLPGLFQVVECLGCGLKRTNPRPSPAHMGYYYPENYGPHQCSGQTCDPARISRPWWKRLFLKVVNSNARRTPDLQPGRMLEIGCSTGDFLAEMAGKGWKVEGIEFSARAAEGAIARGYSVNACTVEEAQYANGTFDLVVGWMVLEHLHQPVAALHKLRDWVKPGGWLVLSVPDARWEFQVFRDRWYALHIPNHLFHFDFQTLSKTLEAAGWRMHKTFWHRNPANFFHSLGYVFGDAGWSGMKNYCDSIAIGKRHKILRMLLGYLLGSARASGRMTVWAQRR